MSVAPATFKIHADSKPMPAAESGPACGVCLAFLVVLNVDLLGLVFEFVSPKVSFVLFLFRFNSYQVYSFGIDEVSLLRSAGDSHPGLLLPRRLDSTQRGISTQIVVVSAK